MYKVFSDKTKAFVYYYENISKKNLKELKHEIKYQNNEQKQDKNLEHNDNSFKNKFNNLNINDNINTYSLKNTLPQKK